MKYSAFKTLTEQFSLEWTAEKLDLFWSLVNQHIIVCSSSETQTVLNEIKPCQSSELMICWFQLQCSYWMKKVVVFHRFLTCLSVKLHLMLTVLWPCCIFRRTASRHQTGPDWTLYRETPEWRGHCGWVASHTGRLPIYGK